jgi:hypothetical protein
MSQIQSFAKPKEDLMTTRFVRLAAFLVPLLAVSAGTSLASSGAAIAATGNPPVAAFCPADSGLAVRRAIRASFHDRLALHCYCCGKDENDHCNHQCCDN